MENVAREQDLSVQHLFPQKSSYFSKNSDRHKMTGPSNLAILMFWTFFFNFWHLLSHY